KSSSKSSSSQSKRKSSTTTAPTKRRPATSNASKVNKNANQAETSTKSSAPKSGKNYKTKIYEKEIDLLLQKIEKLEKQQNIKTDQKDVLPDKVANSDLFKGRPTDIADKLKGFLGGHGPEENREHAPQHNDWQPSGAMAPPPPPMHP